MKSIAYKNCINFQTDKANAQQAVFAKNGRTVVT